jgi:fatty acid desaturase
MFVSRSYGNPVSSENDESASSRTLSLFGAALLLLLVFLFLLFLLFLFGFVFIGLVLFGLWLVLLGLLGLSLALRWNEPNLTTARSISSKIKLNQHVPNVKEGVWLLLPCYSTE